MEKLLTNSRRETRKLRIKFNKRLDILVVICYNKINLVFGSGEPSARNN
jgi:hypothetical protein